MKLTALVGLANQAKSGFFQIISPRENLELLPGLFPKLLGKNKKGFVYQVDVSEFFEKLNYFNDEFLIRGKKIQ